MLVRGHPDFVSDVVYISLELAIAVLAIAGNVLVCWAVCLNSNLQNVTNYFVASLAVADVAVGVLAIPFAVTVSTGFCASFYGYNALVTGSRAKGIIAICWALSFVIGLTPMLGWNRRPATNGNASRNAADGANNCSANMVPCLFEGVVTMEYMVYYNFFACVLVPLLLMFGIYLKIFMAARRQLKQIGNKVAAAAGGAAAHGERSCSVLQKEVHAAKSLAIIVGLFAVCWLPLHIINCYTLFCRGCARPPLWLMYVAILLSHANSVVNPLIYAYRIREFRHTFRKILGQHVLCKTAPFRTASRKASSHGGENGERVAIRSGGRGIDYEDSEGVPSQTGADGWDGEANGHIRRPFCRNGDIPGPEQFSEDLLARRESLAQLETSAFDLSSVS
ncbi:hypothetical protein JD844_015266 [Phrynosoma platyrhinos]|uniref:Adenosine receptor A2 n=1 Tax=Phrynosoma platyrhinos TaxID=52577 RepID=A0ABQ7T892_PHRPL|nr:hypothetical protein JD844_015266 [Phrynosoma platyrhinos]